MKAHFLLFAAVLAAGISCTRTALEGPDRLPGGVEVRFSLERSEPPSRSSFCPEQLDAISDINVWIYQEGVLLPDYSFHTELGANAQVPIVFPSLHASYNIYFLANMGEVAGPTLEEGIGDVAAAVDSYASFTERGFPMAGTVLAYSPSGSGSVSLSRLVGRFDITAYDNPANTRISYTFLSGKMKACARVIRPFGTLQGEARYASRAEAAVEVIAEGDSLSAADIASLNAGGTVSLYYLENCQGQLLPENDSQWGKSADAIAQATGDPSLADLCSYLELTCRAETPTATYPSVIYRAYLGRDATGDFSVVRNTVNPLRLDMASELIASEDWFVEPSEPDITGRLCFADTRFTSYTCPSAYQTNTDANEYRRPFRTVSSIFLMYGFDALYYVYRSNPKTKYTIRSDISSTAAPFVSYQASEIDDNFTAILISTSRQPDGPALSYGSGTYSNVYHYMFPSYSFYRNPYTSETENVNFYIESYDGLLRDTLTVKVLKRLPSAKLEYSSSSGQLMCRFSNPLGLKIYTHISGSIEGSVSYKPNGTAFASKTSTRKVVFTKSWDAFSSAYGYANVCPAIKYADNSSSSYTSAGTASKFSDCFDCIWNLTGWDSYTKLNGSNGYNKHAHPTSMEIRLIIQYDSPCIYRLLPNHSAEMPFNLVNHEARSVAPSGGAVSSAITGTDIGFSYSCADKAGGSATTYTFPKNTGILTVYNFASSITDYSSLWVSDALTIPEYSYQATSGPYPDESWLSSLGFNANRMGNIAVSPGAPTVID
ncbi:MAG: DUF4906 domain-containing protein [Bacteroidales bacterium]|nr:DUF4906 domain-containing protein [Bacteroidales bacterium]